jgi:signal transduction histidine kinase
VEIALYSKDPELRYLCSELARSRPGSRCVVNDDLTVPPAPTSTISIYDTTIGSVEALPDSDNIRNAILIADRAELPQICLKMLHLSAIVLLRPVNRARLEIALEQSADRPNDGREINLMRRNRDELLECLLHANFRLQQHDQDRSHFLMRAIHELRAPLNSLSGYCGLLVDRKLGSVSNEQIAVLERMRRSVDRLNRIVTSIFDLNIGRSVAHQPEYQVNNIVASIEQALHEVAPMVRDRGIELDISFSAPAGPLYFDRQQMEQVFLNLLDNSCKFTDRGGLIRVVGYPYYWERANCPRSHVYCGESRRDAAAPLPNSYRVDIADSGPGIPPDRLERTFDEGTLYGGGNDRSGAGLGLPICRMLVRQHNGGIWAESDGTTGAKFCVALPHSPQTSGTNTESPLQTATSDGCVNFFRRCE